MTELTPDLTILRRQSPNCDTRPEPGGVFIDTLILHYTGMQTGQAAIERLCDREAKVSSHYVVEEDGTIWCLVDEAMRGYHAGISYWRGRRALNDVSIGIEIVNPGHEWGYRPFPAAQIAAVTALCRQILARHPIPPGHVLGHSDIAPNRKQDPGELFPWRQLAEAGIGLWPQALAQLPAELPGPDFADEDVAHSAWAEAAAALAGIGYEIGADWDADALRVPLLAFQRHWHARHLSGRPDAGTLAALREVGAAMAQPGMARPHSAPA